MTSEAYRKDQFKIPSRTPGWNLDAWRFLPEGEAASRRPLPVVVMAHGLGANKLMGIEPYAREFARKGWAAVVFDYRRWGSSDGTPRNVLYITEQLEDYRTVIQFCKKESMFDPHRIVVWGTSFAGGHATSLASEPKLGLIGAIGQCPYMGNPPIQWNHPWALYKTIVLGLWDYVRQALGLSPTYIPTVSEPGQVGVMTVAGWRKDMFALADDPRHYSNTISASSMFEVPLYNPSAHASSIHCPLLLIPTSLDKLCRPEGAREVQRAAKKGLVRIKAVPGDHFVPYPRQPQYNASLQAQLEFLREILDNSG